MNKIILKSLATIAVVVTLSGCGGGGDGSTKNSTTITFNGLTYKTVTSPATNRVWLDRNIGASRVCESFDDMACYGDYFQWGRNADGHEDVNSGVTSNQASNIANVGHSQFITATYRDEYDWAYNADPDGSKREAQWRKTDGTSVCPQGFRVPTKEEFDAEIKGLQIEDRVDAYESFLKLPAAGVRYARDGALMFEGDNGFYWTSNANSKYANRLKFTSSYIEFGDVIRAGGEPVRCIKE